MRYTISSFSTMNSSDAKNDDISSYKKQSDFQLKIWNWLLLAP